MALIALDYAIPLQDGYRPNSKVKSVVNRLFAEGAQLYFPARSIFLPKLSKEQTYILAAWPHGLMGGGNHYGFCDFDRAGFYPIYSGASIILYLPFVRRFISMMGWTSVTRAGLSKVLDAKRHGSSYPFSVVHLVVGGIHEMFCTPGYARNEEIIISKRKGFIKLALQTGADIIPMYSFGANQTYYRLAGMDSWLCRLSTVMQVSVTPWFGRFWIPFGFIPFQRPILTVTGDVFAVPKVAPSEVSDELVRQVHADFRNALRHLFDTYKVVYVEEMGAEEIWRRKELKFEDDI
jgi:Diacylglycerol acyltransferase